MYFATKFCSYLNLKENKMKEKQENKVGGAMRSDTGKPRLDLLSPVAMEGTAQILTFGAVKYSPGNWKKGMAWSRCIASLMRHLFKFMSGEDFDKESGLPHIDHVACNVMFLQEYFRTHQELDDRCKDETINMSPKS